MTVVGLKRVAELASLGAVLGAKSGQRGRRLASKLGSLHGLPQKVGQLLALGELNEGDAVFAELTGGGHAMSPKKARTELEREFGQPLATLFGAFNLKGIGASLGQVHRAVLHDGREVAVKLQYPGIAEAVRVDLQALGLLGQAYRRGYDLRAYRQTLGQMIARELDYRLEAQALERFGALAATDPHVVTPRLVPELCRERVLTMTWLEGLTLEQAKARPVTERASASRAVVRWFLRSVLEWGLVHGDGHPGNLRFVPDGRGGLRLGVLDFGCVQALDGPMAGGLRLLVEHVAAGADDPPTHWLSRYEAMGFSRELLEPVAGDLAALSRLLVAPLATSGAFDPAQWALNDRIKNLMGDRRFAFRFAAPSAFAFVTRAFIGLVQTLKALDAPIAWRPLFEDISARATMAPVAELILPTAPPKPLGTPPLSRHLRIHIQREGGARIDLTFPSRAAENLSGLVPPEITPRIAARGIDVQALEVKAVSTCFAPGELFRFEEPQREVRVWLE